ncbi:MAG: DNA internalization-related competence protein ComEC/Rec2 [Hungatella sp.]
MKIKRPLVWIAGGFVLGEAWTLLPVVWEMGILGICLSGFLMLRNIEGRSLQLGLLLLCGLLGWGRMNLARQSDPSAVYVEQLGEHQVEIRARIKRIEAKENSYALTLSPGFLYRKTENYPFPAVRLYIPKEAFEQMDSRETVRIGMEISAWGQPEKPGVARNPGEFDNRSYAYATGIAYQMFGSGCQLTDTRYSFYYDGLYRVKQAAAHRLDLLCEPEDAGILKAALLGDKSSLDETIQGLYQRNGIAHLLAISGLHISLVGLSLYRLLRKAGLSYGWSGCVGILFVISYGILTGGSASVVRAVIMVLVSILAEYLGRSYDMLSAAALAAILLLLEYPYLLFQGGFQLSFGAVGAIGGLAPWLVKNLTWKKPWQQSILMGISIQLLTYPILLYHFFQYPLYGILLNLLVIPLMAYVILSGMSGLLLGMLSPGLAMAALGSEHYILRFYEWLCRMCEHIPGSNLILGRPPAWQILLYYPALLFLLFWIWTRRKKQEVFESEGAPIGNFLVFGGGCLICFCLLLKIPMKGVEVTFLDVRQGDGICLQTRQAVILVDGGSSSQKEIGKRSLEPFLKSRGISRIDYAIVSHGDQDHINGLVYLLGTESGIAVEHLVLPKLAQEEPGYELLEELAHQKKIPIHWMKRGEKIRAGNLVLTCIYDGNKAKKGEKNEHSLLLAATYGDMEMLLTGDMSGDGEGEILSDPKLAEKIRDISILKVAHHGSKYSSRADFLQSVNPVLAVISCGEDNTYGHPHPETMKRLQRQNTEILTTMDRGAITVYSDGSKVAVRCFLSLDLKGEKRDFHLKKDRIDDTLDNWDIALKSER